MALRPEDLPSTFWRVSAKALIFDEEQRLLVLQDDNGLFEMPGGGWERGESLEECIARELAEEIGLDVIDMGSVKFCYTSTTSSGFPKISIAVRVKVPPGVFKFSSDDLVGAKYVTKHELMQLNFQSGERAIIDQADKIWQRVEKPPHNL